MILIDEIANDESDNKELRLGVTCFGDDVAPCFETAHRFRLWRVALKNVQSLTERTVSEEGGLARIRLLRQVGVVILICNGISEHSRQILEAEGCRVIHGVVGSADEAVSGVIAGRLKPLPRKETQLSEPLQPHTVDLILWTKDLFKSYAWEVRRVTQPNLFPVDLLAQRACPVCQLPVRAAICCGAHVYSVADEIEEFKRVTAGYHARVYVHHALLEIVEKCRNFDIELLDPREFRTPGNALTPRRVLPPLNGPISDHERLTAW